jgi:choline dehydrogenase-like flavoprotein
MRLLTISQSTTFNPSKTGNKYETFNASAYSDGPLQISYADFVTPASRDFIEAIDDLGIAPIVEDLNLGNNIGTKQQPLTMDKLQQRSSSYDSYFMQAQNRTNLDVVPYGLVQQILTTGNGSDISVTGVYLSSQSTGQVITVSARKEVIVSGGAFQSPQLLMLSGIGPADELAKYGIPLVLDVPTIGKNMQDHNYFSVMVRVNSSTSIDSFSESLNDPAVVQAAAEEYLTNRTGIMTTPGGTTYGFQQVPVADLQAMGAVELENRTQQAHIEYLFEPTYYPSQPSPNGYQYAPWANETFVSITAGMIAPASRGTVTLQSRLITDQPVINVNYFNATTDQKMGVYAFKNLRKILAHPSVAAWTIGPDNGEVVPGVDVQTDEEILNHIQNTAIPIWHASATCAMLPQEKGGVVDSRLRLYGIKNLRVVDASIMPVVPDQHTMGAVYMLAEKASDMIKEDYGLPTGGVQTGASRKRSIRRRRN